LFLQDIPLVDHRWVAIDIQLDAGPTPDTTRIATINPHATIASRWCAVSTWRDAFDTPTFAPEASGESENCTIAEADGVLTLTVQTGQASCSHKTSRAVDLRDGTVTMKVTPAATPVSTKLVLRSRDYRERIEIKAQGALTAYVASGGEDVYAGGSQLPSTGEHYWRVRLAGTTLRIETSLDGNSWDLRTQTVVPTLDASAMFINREVYVNSNANANGHRAVFGALQ
jgi:hypothetical protein